MRKQISTKDSTKTLKIIVPKSLRNVRVILLIGERRVLQTAAKNDGARGSMLGFLARRAVKRLPQLAAEVWLTRATMDREKSRNQCLPSEVLIKTSYIACAPRAETCIHHHLLFPSNLFLNKRGLISSFSLSKHVIN